MPKKPKVIVVRTAGTNCDQETAFAFQSFGAKVDLIHVKKILNKQALLADYHILALPGGFTYGDDIESGRILANELRLYLADAIDRFVKQGKLILGVCNGFQVLVKAGILPGRAAAHKKQSVPQQQTTLISNDSGKFEDRWTYLKVSGDSVWVKGLKDIVYFPVAHAEGKFVARSASALKSLRANGQIAFRYCTRDGRDPVYPENPNGSQDHIAGITDPSGHVLGLMPHPERHLLFQHHPFWSRLSPRAIWGDGAKVFENGVAYVRQKFL
jgi:phosphoribosylformylglycinamidine synthase